MPDIRVLLAEDHTIVRKGLRSLLEAASGIQVIAEASDGREAVTLTREHVPDVVVMDISMPNLNGLEATQQIRKQFPEVQVLILTVHTTDQYLYQILKAGASGYVVKQAAPEELIEAIRCVHRGESFLSPAVSRLVVEGFLKKSGPPEVPDKYETLTSREREVLQLLAEGCSTREAAGKLFISVKTVETHRAHIQEKLDLHSTAELIRYAIQRGIIESL